jgi:hypothetical protein
LTIPRIHAVKWADGVAPDGTAVRVFGWWVWPDGPWGYEVWQPGTSIRAASAAINPARRTRLLDENGFGLYDADGQHLYEWPYYAPETIVLDTGWYIEHKHGGEVTSPYTCAGCEIEDAIDDAAWDQYVDGREV